jgi:RNA polymerase-interacting CarD/CdnL/TRCF family regulator
VKEIVSVDMGGTAYQMYQIKILENGLTYSVPVDAVGANGIREVISMAAVEKVYEVLRDKEDPRRQADLEPPLPRVHVQDQDR